MKEDGIVAILSFDKLYKVILIEIVFLDNRQRL